MNKGRILRIVCNTVTGMFVTAMTLTAFAISGIAESDQPTNNYSYFLWLIVWMVGLAMQFNKKTKVIGIAVTFIPVLYFLFKMSG